MVTDRIHRAVSRDGTHIAGRVHGQGPPLVLVPDLGHLGPEVEPEPVAAELVGLLEAATTPQRG